MGKVMVRLDNDRRVLGVTDTTRPVAGLVDQILAAPPVSGQTSSAEPVRGSDPQNALAKGWQRRMKAFVIDGSLPRAYAVVPGSTEVGYSIRGNTAILVARQEIEADLGNGLFKRYVIEEPIAG